MEEIGTNRASYSDFIEKFRGAFEGKQPFTAYKEKEKRRNEFHYTPEKGNLYLKKIGAKSLSKLEIMYGPEIGEIVSPTFMTALLYPYSKMGGDFKKNLDAKKNLDIVLLCTVEAARSDVILEKVISMLDGGTIQGSDLKVLAQCYDHTRTEAKITKFEPLSRENYRKYANKKLNTTDGPAISAIVGPG